MSDSQLNRIEDKLDVLQQQQSSTNVKLAEYNILLEEHVRRTTQIEIELMPIAKAHERWKGAVWLLGALCALAGAIGAMAWMWA